MHIFFQFAEQHRRWSAKSIGSLTPGANSHNSLRPIAGGYLCQKDYPCLDLYVLKLSSLHCSQILRDL
jgi:hypothetical protein